MKTPLLTLSLLVLFAFVACEMPTSDTAESEAPDYALFDMKADVAKKFMQAHVDENLGLQGELLADTLQWSPPQYNGNQWLGKADYLEVLKGYHDGFENIKFSEGVVLPDRTEHGIWSGSVFPKDSATDTPDILRLYGTWTATHSATGKEIGVKWFALCSVNADGKIAAMSEYWDLGGLLSQIAVEEETGDD